jgi:hypothetical protein
MIRRGLRASSVLSKIEGHEAALGGLKLTLRQNQDESGGTYVSFDTLGSNFTGFGQFGAGTSFNHLGENYSELFAEWGCYSIQSRNEAREC